MARRLLACGIHGLQRVSQRAVALDVICEFPCRLLRLSSVLQLANWCSHPGGVGSKNLRSLARVHHGVRVMVDSCVHVHVYLMVIVDRCMCIERQFECSMQAYGSCDKVLYA